MIKYTKEKLETSGRSYFQAQFRATKAELEDVIGHEIETEIVNDKKRLVFDGFAVLEDGRSMPVEIQTYDTAEVPKWHLRTLLYHDGMMLRADIRDRIEAKRTEKEISR